jgi:hypothetical protein
VNAFGLRGKANTNGCPSKRLEDQEKEPRLHLPDADFELLKFAMDPAEAAHIVDRGECQRVVGPSLVPLQRSLVYLLRLAQIMAESRRQLAFVESQCHM